MSRDTIAISGVQLFRLGDHAIVRVEIDGAWCEVISERYDGMFSHIVEVPGMRKAAAHAGARDDGTAVAVGGEPGASAGASE